MQDKYVGLILAVTSTLAIGSSFVITKKGLNEAAEHHGFEGDGFTYLQRPIWWIGILTMVIGEVANFAAYAFAPAILVTPLGALSVLIGAVLGTYFLNERLGLLGKIGCAICLLGSVIIVLHAPPDPEIDTIDQLLEYAMKPGFMFYCVVTTIFAVFMIYRIAPKYGKKNPLVYLSICSTVGSISIMAIKAFGIAVKLTFAGNNQFTHASTYVFMIVVVVCIMTQMNYFNKALSPVQHKHVSLLLVLPFQLTTHPPAASTPSYYVTFTTATLCASFIMFQGFNTTGATNTLSLLCGFLVIFSGVYLLNLSRKDPVGDTLLGSGVPGQHGGFEESAIPTDSLTAFAARQSLQARRSSADGAGGSSARHSRQHSWGSSAGGGGRRSIGDREALMHDYALHDLAETSEDEPTPPATRGGQQRLGDEEQLLGAARPPPPPQQQQHPYGVQGQGAVGSAPRLSGSGRARERDQLQKPAPGK